MPNESKNLIIPHGWLKAVAGALPATPALPANYTVDFGQFANGSFNIGGDIKENFTGLNGIVGLDKQQRVRATLEYEFDAKYFPAAQLAMVFGCATGAAPNPGKVFDMFCWMGMAAQDEAIQSDGTGLFVHHSFKAGVKYLGGFQMNGDDFAMMKLQVSVYLGSHPGITSWSATRPVPIV